MALCACADGDVQRIAPHLVEAVQVSKLEPGGYCRPLGALEAQSECCELSGYESAYALLRASAALRGGNYVVIDHVRGPTLVGDSMSARATFIAGRVFACELGGPYAGVRLPLPPPPPQVSDDDSTVLRAVPLDDERQCAPER